MERAYAKVNLTLDVLYKRSDQYHEVEMVMQTIDLSDLIWLDELPGEHIVVESTASHIPLDGRNLAVMAARVFKDATGISKGLKISIDKQIPVAAGLGGGSADAAAVLRGLNRLWNTGFTLAELAQLGASIGSDVPFCVYEGCAVARGRGEEIEPIHHPLQAWVVLVRPPVFVSTADVYGALAVPGLPDEGRVRATKGMVRALMTGSLDEVRRSIRNDLAATTMSLYPEVHAMKQRMESTAHTRVYMSGSGPTLFCLLPTQKAAQRMYNALRGFTREVILSRWVLSGGVE